MIQLLLHQWKEAIRSTFWEKNLITNIFLGFIGLYLLTMIATIGYYSDVLLIAIFPDQEVIRSATRLAFYYFVFELITRFTFQALPSLSINPYLTLPIKKSTLLHYLLIKSIFNFFNLIRFLLFITFYVKNFSTESNAFGHIWLISMLSIIGINNYLNFLLKKFFSLQPLITILIIICVAAIAFLDYNGVLAISTYFSKFIFFISNGGILFITLPILMAIAYTSVYFYLKNNAYLEDKTTDNKVNNSSFAFLEKQGHIGNLISLDFKLIARNKRPKSMLYLSIFFLLYGFYVYKNTHDDPELVFISFGLLMTNLVSINFGQFFFAWESSFLDMYFVNKIAVSNYIKSKFLFFTLGCLLTFLITIPYGFLNSKIFLYHSAFLLYNLGITSFIILYVSTFNLSRIDLGKSQFMNYEGTSISQFLLMIPVIGIPLFLYWMMHLLHLDDYYLYLITLLGLVGVLAYDSGIKLISAKFLSRKYKMAYSFRQK